MNFLMGLAGIAFSIVMIKYREMVVDMVGDAEWMSWVGGPYMVVVYAALILCMWGFAMMFGLTDQAMAPIIRFLMPWAFEGGASPVDGF